MEKTRDLQEKTLPQPERKQPEGEREVRSEPEPIDDEELLKLIGGGGSSAPRGNW